MSARFVLVASAFGRTLAREAAEEGAGFLVSPDGQSIPKTLLRAGGSQRVLDLWLEQIRECARLRPVEEKVLIVVNADHAAAYEAWARACGFPVANIINNGSRLADATRPGFLADVALVAAECPPDAWLLAADTDYCFHPHFPLVRFVASAFVSGRLTIAAVAPGSPADEAGAAITAETVPVFAAPSAQAACSVTVASVSLGLSEGAQMRSIPLLGMPPAAVAALQTHAGAQACPWQSLERFVVEYIKTAPVSGFVVPAVFAVRSLRQLLFADRFFAHWKARCVEVAGESSIQAAKCAGARSTVGGEVLIGVQPSAAFPALPVAGAHVEADVLTELADFRFEERAALITRSQVEGSDVLLPKRFVRSHEWDYSARRPQHPSYTTSSNAYGMRSPLKADMPMTWSGAKGEFTKTFAGMARDQGLRCGVERSRTHRTLDEL